MAVAQQATIDMFHDVRRAVNNDQLFGTYLGMFLSEVSMEGITGNGINLVQMKPQMKPLPTDDELLLLQYVKQMNGKYMYTPPSSAHLLSKTVYFLNQIQSCFSCNTCT